MGYTSFSNLPLSAYNELSSKVEDRVYFINDEGTIRLNEVTYGAGGGGGDKIYVEPDYLTFTAEEANSAIRLFKSADDASLSAVLEYSTDGETWTNYEWSETAGTVITLANVGDYVKFRGDNKTFSINESIYYTFAMTGKIAGSGAVDSLLSKNVKDAKLSNFCYSNMFYWNAALTTAPALPATTLADSCYNSMFSNCTSLTTAPALPATSLADYCYSYMFFRCTSLTTAPALPATTLALGCYASMFSNCTSLTTAPALLATTLVYSCYSNMFYLCYSLTTVPALPATTLDGRCYSELFSGCSELSRIEVSFDSWPSGTVEYGYSTYEWLSNVAASGTFCCPYGLDTSIRDGSHIPVGWDIVYTDVPESVLSGISATEAALTMN